MHHVRARRHWILSLTVAAGALAALAAAAAEPPAGEKKPPVLELDEKPAFPLPAHLEQRDIAAGKMEARKLVEAGGDLFHTVYNGLDGVGMLRTVGGKPLHRFSIGVAGGGQPIAVGAQSCGGCHGKPFAAGAGAAHTQVVFDDDGDGEPPFRFRSTTSTFGNGLLQLLAQEMTEELHAARERAVAVAKLRPGVAAREPLHAKGVDFGVLAATADAAGAVSFDLTGVVGVDPDLVVRPFGWKGNVTTLRAFQVFPATFGMGMMAEEFVWRLPPEAQPDPDGDGVTRELSVGDITAMTLYNAAQETPESVERLAAQGLVAAPAAEDLARVARGREVFARVGCASCHAPEMRLANAVYEEPTKRGGGAYLDPFLAGKDPDYDPARPARLDLAAEGDPPRVEPHPAGGYVVRLHGDLKRHRMGRHLADEPGPQPPLTAALAPLEIDGKMALIQPDEFLTAELWGVGNTQPYLHDGRAGSLAEAILLHGEDAPLAKGEAGRSEAQEARDAFKALTAEEQRAVVSFLKSLVNFEVEERSR